MSLGRQVRRKLLGLLDEVDFSQRYPPTMHLEFFELSMIEQAIQSVETKTEQDVLYCDVRRLHRVLMNELNNVQGNIMVTQRPRVLEVRVKGQRRNVTHLNCNLKEYVE